MKKFKAIPGKGVFASSDANDYYYNIGRACLNPSLVDQQSIKGRYFDPESSSYKSYNYTFKSEDDKIRAEEELGKSVAQLYAELTAEVHQILREYTTSVSNSESNRTRTDETSDGILINGDFTQFLLDNLNADSSDVELVAHNNWGDRMTPDEFADELYDAAISNGISGDELDYSYILEDVKDAFNAYSD